MRRPYLPAMRLPSLLLLLCAISATAQSPVLLSTDLAPFHGNWNGELMYIDYTSGAETHIPANLSLAPLGTNSWSIGFGYAEEPHANEMDTLLLSTDGRELDGFEVDEVMRFASDSVRVVLRATGEDDERPATLRKTWTAGPHTCTLRKEVLLLSPGSDEPTDYFLRHEYRFMR